MDVGSDHIWKNVLLCIGLRDARCTRLIGVSSPLSILYMSQIVCSQLTVNFAANGVLDSSNSTEFLISVYFIIVRYRTSLIEHFKASGYFLYHKFQHPKYHIQSTDCSVPVFCVDLRTNSGYFSAMLSVRYEVDL